MNAYGGNLRATAWWVVLAFGCGDTPGAGTSAGAGELTSDFVNRLTESGGCGDVVLFASSAEDDVAIRFQLDGVAEQAHAVDEVLTWTYRLDSDPIFEVRVGEAVTADICGDGVSIPSTVYRPTSGTASLTVAKRTGTVEFPAFYEISLQETKVSNEDGHEVDMSWWSFAVDVR